MDQYFRIGIKFVAIRLSTGEILSQNFGNGHERTIVKVLDQITSNLFMMARKSSKHVLCLNGKNGSHKILTKPCPVITVFAEHWGSGDSE